MASVFQMVYINSLKPEPLKPKQGLLSEIQSQITSNINDGSTNSSSGSKQTNHTPNLAILATSLDVSTFTFEIGSWCTVLAVLELTKQTRLALNTKNPTASARIKAMCHHTW